KSKVEDYLNTLGILYTFRNTVDIDETINLESVNYYEFKFNDSVSIPEESLNETPTDASTTDTDVTTNDEVQEQSRNIENQTSNYAVNIVGGGIQNIFPPTIQLPSINFDVDAPEATKEE